MTQELRKLAEAATQGKWKSSGFSVNSKEHGWATIANTEFDYDGMAENAAYIAAANPAAILELLDRVEKAEKDAERWRNLCDLVNEERASVTFYGRLSTINTGLEVHDSGDLHDELDIAMEASK